MITPDEIALSLTLAAFENCTASMHSEIERDTDKLHSLDPEKLGEFFNKLVKTLENPPSD